MHAASCDVVKLAEDPLYKDNAQRNSSHVEADIRPDPTGEGVHFGLQASTCCDVREPLHPVKWMADDEEELALGVASPIGRPP